MDPKKDGHKGQNVPCPVCDTEFFQRKDGRPKTCSRTCARQKDWETRERKGRYVNNKGYVLVVAPDGYVGKTYKLAEKSRAGYVLEHRLVMEQKLGRVLHSEETVHHKNGDRSDNRPENLELRVGRHGVGATEKHCRTCTCFGH